MRAARPAVVGGVALLALACNSGPTSVMLPPLEAVVASGDGQYGTSGQTLQIPLQVIIRSLSTGLARSGTNVLWAVEEGDASIAGIANTITDETGSANVTVRLGSVVGGVTVRATVDGQDRATVTFHLFLVDRPILDALTPVVAAPGESVTLTGSNFSPVPEQNIVLFSGVRGLVSAASSTEIVVQVPPCLPARDVLISVQLGIVASGSRTLSVGTGGDVNVLQVCETFEAVDEGGFTCVTLPGDGTASYLAVVYSASTVGAASHPFRLSGLGSSVPFATSAAPTPHALTPRLTDAQGSWDYHLRTLEAKMTRGRTAPIPERAPLGVDGPAAIPTVGERRTFNVFRNGGGFTEVTAVAQFVGARAALFVDEDAPAGGYTQADLQMYSDRFDEVIYPTVTGAFGTVSDLDANERIVILFTPSVNALTARGALGFVAGFFFGLDLLPSREGSNSAEIFYALVPDATGLFSDPRTKDELLELMPAVLGHEFQHMVNFNERVLRLGAEANEALWLSEGLAQYAEELVALAYESLGDAESVRIFREGVQDRSRRYLTGTDSVSLIVSTGQGTLTERGAGFLHILYLVDRFGADLPGRLTRTTRTGVANVEVETGTNWADLLSDWWSAVFMDGPGPESGALVYPTVDLRQFLGDPFPLVPDDLGPGDVTRSGALRSSSAGYYIVTPESGGSMTLRLGGEAGGASAPQAGMRMRIIRVQ